MSGVPYTFGTATTSIPLSNLDSNFVTPVTIGNASVALGNTITTIGNLTLTNPTIGSVSSITFSDSTTQTTSAVVGGKVPYSIMPKGSVLQVVNATYSTQVSTASATAQATGLTASITPLFSTSKILILITHTGVAVSGPATAIILGVTRGGTPIAQIGNVLGYPPTGGVSFSNAGIVLDSPNTTSSTTYATTFSNWQATATVYCQWQSSTSYITLMEIAG